MRGEMAPQILVAPEGGSRGLYGALGDERLLHVLSTCGWRLGRARRGHCLGTPVGVSLRPVTPDSCRGGGAGREGPLGPRRWWGVWVPGIPAFFPAAQGPGGSG